ncbi:MAG: RecQ family ATP-dependent DNA helicase [Vagococcus sp.]|uniref:RecQ family ATP-dependent DNA helicase n=1 Tax=Vagococcus TaxID=2737 RepID=UPI002FC9ADE7
MTDLKTFLQQKFHFSSFKEGQEETIQSLIEGNDTFTILPTGTGKSLCYQLPSYLLEGQTIIVSPLISLMEDQVSQLRQMGEKSVIAINSTLDFSSKQYVLNHLESFKFIFLSPETLNQPEVLARMRALRIGLFVIDEAHCISEWGHDFRPSYLSLKKNLDILGSPLTLALTATATDSVKEDIKGQLFVNNQVQEFFYSVNRENIFYEVACCEDKVAFLTEFLAERDMPGIIYFSSKKEAERVSGVLNDTLPYPVSYYHGDLSSSDRVKIQQQFIHDEIRVLCATSAFGMGINKENVRFVIHYHLPDSLENYVQESGRAGRDHKQSLSIILYQGGDERIHHFLQEESFNQKKDLLFLRDKTKEQLKDYQHLLTDTQKKWLLQLEESDWDWENFEASINLKQFEKNSKMNAMTYFINTKTCRRQFILNYFSNDFKKVSQDNCCDNCQVDRVELFSEIPLLKNEKEEFDAKSLLKKLFLNKI